MIVVAILVDIMLIAMPAFIRARNTTQNTRFLQDIRTATGAFEMYAAENSKYPPECGPGIIPTGMAVYLNGFDWQGINSLGGNWDWEFQKNSTTAQVATTVSFVDDVRMADIDARFDNGILTTGAFRKRDTQLFAYILE
ncbi:MAG: ral secretion pathway protein [Chthoniobacter sp.]|nr:ral secretion pathway protein [Chthoniobacter sp.]